MKNCIVVTDVVMMLQVPTKVLCNMWSYHVYYMTISTEEQRHHMIKISSMIWINDINWQRKDHAYLKTVSLFSNKALK